MSGTLPRPSPPPSPDRTSARTWLRLWRDDPALATVRGAAGALPAGERPAWADVDQLLVAPTEAAPPPRPVP